MIFSLITNDVSLAKAAQSCGIERILLDLERRGKAERQAGRELFLSDHKLEDTETLSAALSQSQLVVRVNSWHEHSGEEIDAVVARGARAVMLPYFHEAAEVRCFLQALDGRALPILLIETQSAANNLDTILELGLRAGAEFHIGLNDLALSCGHRTFWPILVDGTVRELAARLNHAGATFGIGGVGLLSDTTLPVNAELFLAFQIAAGATRGWLGRSFRHVFENDSDRALAGEIAHLREHAAVWQRTSSSNIQAMHGQFQKQIEETQSTIRDL